MMAQRMLFYSAQQTNAIFLVHRHVHMHLDAGWAAAGSLCCCGQTTPEKGMRLDFCWRCCCCPVVSGLLMMTWSGAASSHLSVSKEFIPLQRDWPSQRPRSQKDYFFARSYKRIRLLIYKLNSRVFLNTEVIMNFEFFQSEVLL